MLKTRANVVLAAANTMRAVRLLKSDQRAVAAVEFAFIATFMSFAILNVVDISIYIYQRMEVANATQMGAQAAWKNCSVNQLPATTSCPTLTNAVQTAVQSTSLGTQVALKSGSPSEGYYCVNSSNALQYVSSVATKPTDCSAAGMPGLQPGDYIQVNTTFPYTPLFPHITVAAGFTTPITQTALMRLE
jgi:Flp pilus assembly protein TadG